ncbi:MAG: Gfo/Idh/MocA family oxidoreductase [Bauldia sp.]|uniref:Gfo/Idh/MocA family protein n=1 Tax=Bauldia sp. TaxID=2575872 RepID=UPI001D83D0C9|nr:Gfo/Idh/MocA family oxidoreductase [Bauldia sp.]MCB1494743.1 Gfo/Idh/MocA family oxidoreductase [Bauldia sp.]
MDKQPIGVGVIGCGEIAQLMHLPYIHELPDLRIAGLCDLSPGTLAALGDHYGVATRTTDYRELLSRPDVDAVVVGTYDHANVVADAIATGKHVLVEKPLAFTSEEAGPLVSAADDAGIVAMVGYMKLYDPGYEIGVERIRQLGKPWSIHMHDFAGRFDRYGALYSQVRPDDIPVETLAAGRQAVDDRIATMLGPDHAGYAGLYLTLLMLGSHDLAVLRGAFGVPAAVAYARQVGPYQLHAVLEYPDGVPCTLEVGFGTQYEWWDEWLAVYGVSEEVRIAFANPYLRHASAAVHVREAFGEGPSDRVLRGSPDTAFRREWMHFLDCIRTGRPPRTPLADGLADLELARDIIKAMPATTKKVSG